MKYCIAAQIAIATLLAEPIHSLVSRITDGVGTPELIIDAGSTPHDFAMRPSEARMISNAEI
ncbi:MAG: hypothetical protein OXI87_23195 [Albidovulum sp.]|nr:hypothetical protein [Albidovulum sp.]MDE0532062.1 hypothetical protein [Albidovulum sp.]